MWKYISSHEGEHLFKLVRLPLSLVVKFENEYFCLNSCFHIVY